MKKLTIHSLLCLLIVFASCSIFKKKDKYGCPTDGRNIGAEKLLRANKDTLKIAKKAKFRGAKPY
jgi:hypothetical protein